MAQKTNEWKLIARQLNIAHVMVERIDIECRGVIQECFVRVFEQWRKQCDPPYKWSTIIDVLEQPSVNEVALAQELRQKYN